MGHYLRTDFSGGWQPSADAFGAPRNCLLRADNLVLDELGALALRQGSQKINTAVFNRTPYAFDHTASFEESYYTVAESLAQFTYEEERAYLPTNLAGNGPADHNYTWEVTQAYHTPTTSLDTDAHSLFTVKLSGIKYRMVGATDAVYANASVIWASMAGSGDTSFGAHMGQVLFARGTTKKKFDGTTVRNWGIAAPSAAPTLTALSADSKVFASCASTESPGFTSNEGTQAFQPDKAGTANAAVELTPDTTTGRAVSTLTYAAPTDFTTYDAAQVGTDEDPIESYNYVTEPQYTDSLTYMFDVNDGTFQEDWYEHTFHLADAVDVVPSAEESIASNYTVEGEDRDRVIGDFEDRGQIVTSFRDDKPASNVGWNHFSLARGQWERHGLTAGKNWSTVKAVRIIVNAIAGGSVAAVRFDDIKIIGGAARPLTGKFKAAVVAVRSDGTYQALSAPSPLSSEIEVKAQGIRATLSTDTISNLDFQVNELWLFLMGGRLNAFYRFTVKTGGPFSGAQTIDATSSELTALIANIRMQTDNTTPPDDIIGIEGPHFDRTLCLTANYIYASQPLNPDSYEVRTVNGLPAEGHVIRVGSAVETALWIKRISEATLFVGTTLDIYRFDGDWTVLPDGSLNVAKRPMHVSEPPVSSAVEVGNVNGVETLIYLSGDGWHALGFGPLVSNAVDLLWRGFTRHGVSYVNITSTTARFRCAVSKNVLFALTPEGSSTTSSATLHAYHFGKQRWYRLTYPQAFRSIYAEYDGTLIAGDSAGFYRILDLATKQDDGVDIPVVLWTPVDDNAEPFTYKDAENLWMRLDTGDNTATVAFHLNGNSTADNSITTAQETTDTENLDVTDTAEFTQLQFRITGSFDTFVFRGWGLRYLDNPAPQMVHDTGFVDLSGDLVKWVDRLLIKAKSPVNLTVTPYWDGVVGTVRTVSVGAALGRATVFSVPLGREDKGRVGRAVITSTSPSHVYWVKFVMRGSGKPLDKVVSLVPEVA